jgi:hypothetical protein
VVKDTVVKDTVVKDTVVKDTVVKDTVVKDTVVKDTVAPAIPAFSPVRRRPAQVAKAGRQYSPRRRSGAR